jgi:hypothetical protein
LWNFLIFTALPKSTILGPITGSVYNDKIYSFNTYFRKLIFPVLYYISIKIIFLKNKHAVFSTSNLRKIIPKNKIKFCLFNFCLLFYSKRKLKKKNIDFLFYLRKHPQKSNAFLDYIIKKLTLLNLKIIIVGDKYNGLKIKNYKNIDRKKLLNLLDRTKYSVMSGDNFYSLFFLDCLSSNVLTFFNKGLKPTRTFFKSYKFQSLDYNKFNLSFKNIFNKLRKKENKIYIHREYLSVERKKIFNFLKNVY